jgi:uncharacterized protein (TIGR03000 family)
MSESVRAARSAPGVLGAWLVLASAAAGQQQPYYPQYGGSLPIVTDPNFAPPPPYYPIYGGQLPFLPPPINNATIVIEKKTIPGIERTALITVILPRDSELLIDGQKTKQGGPVRQFRSPPLEIGTFKYSLTARWNEGGRKVEQVRQVDVGPGREVLVNFNTPESMARNVGGTPPADAPKPDAPKADAPKPDAPKPDAPKVDAPKPKVDAPKPKVDAPKP